MAWTKEQETAIYKDGTNIIVSAGAGSGKTAVLTERVLEKVKNGISVDNLLILTFTKMAAKEMRERIGDKLKKAGLTSELSKLDTADITTFDAYALSLVKKYHYYLNVSKDISIIDSSVITLYKRKVLKDIFNELYNQEDSKFLSLIKEYSLKDDKEIFDFILNINNKLDLKTNKREYLDNYINIKYNNDNIDKDIEEYIKVILNLTSNIRDYIEYIELPFKSIYPVTEDQRNENVIDNKRGDFARDLNDYDVPTVFEDGALPITVNEIQCIQLNKLVIEEIID